MAAIGEYDVLVIGGGLGGIYTAYKLSRLGLSFKVIEAGGGPGGTWYWNRYPGCRCDNDSLDYSFSFSEDLQQDWTWSERYAGQPEILDYLNHVVDRFDLRSYFQFDSKVSSARWDAIRKCWEVTIGDTTLSSRFVIMATGFLSSPIDPDIAGLSNFAGETYFASRWPHHSVEYAGKRVGIVGTGLSGIQIIPVVAKEAANVTVFQRTANYSVPAKNGPVDPAYLAEFKARYPQIRSDMRNSWLASYWSTYEVNDRSGHGVSDEERLREYEWRWQRGGQGFMVAYNDLMTDLSVNRTCADFVRSKIGAIVKDPVKRATLMPPEDNAIACKRLCIDTDYFETYNNDHVDIVDLRTDPIVRVEADGVRTGDGFHACDMLIFATGFDAFTGALSKIDIQGLDGFTLQQKWATGLTAYMGVMTAGFPNMLFVNGPLSAPGNFMTTTELLVDRIVGLIERANRDKVAVIDTTIDAENAWLDEVQQTASSMPALLTCKSWLLGSNVPGKTNLFLTYFGGLPKYYGRWDDLEADGLRGFVLTKATGR
jgi:cyclohexanone monooxygenase